MNGAHRPIGEHHRDPTASAATRVGLYTRGHEPSTLERQDAALRQYLATVQPHWRVVAVYRDTAPAGGWRDIRPGLRHALAAAGAGTYDVLLVQHLDRLSRRVEQLAALVAAFEAASVTVCCTGLSDSPLETLRLLLWATSFADDDRTGVAARPPAQHAAAGHPPGTAAPVAVPAAPARLALTTHPAPGPEVAMSRIIRHIDRGTRTVDGVEVQISELVWDDEGRSFEVHRADTGIDLTVDGCFDTWPTDEQIADLLHTCHGLWSCPGCGATIDASQPDLVTDHVRDCDRVDGAGQPHRGGGRR